MRLRHPKTMLGFASLVVATFSIIPLPSPVAGAATTGHPNIVLILTDDMRWDEMENMPAVENELVAKGVNFTNAFVSNSLCCPSRASTLTGQFSHTNGVWRNAPPYGGYKAFLPHESDTVATRLHAAGYTTRLVGKYMNGYTAKATRNPSGLASRPGWDTWVAFLGGNPISESPAYFNYTLDANGASQVYGTTEADYSTDVLGAKATEFVRNAPRTAPWFLYFAPYGPHHPYTPAQRYTTSLPNCPKGVNRLGVIDRIHHRT